VREIAEALRGFRAAGVGFAVATVVRVRGSAPRPAGAALAVTDDGEVVGSVSGGCVDGDVYETARQALRAATPTLASYGIADDDALTIGLTCGGAIDIAIIPYPAAAPRPALDAALAAVATGEPIAVLTVLAGPALGTQTVVGPDPDPGQPPRHGPAPFTATLAASDSAASDSAASGSADPAVSAPVDDAPADGAAAGAVPNDAAERDARAMLSDGRTGVRRYGLRAGETGGGVVPVFVQSFTAPPRMIVIGAVDYAAALARAGRFLGYRVTVCDPRPVFATGRRFPDADEVVCGRPAAYLDGAQIDRDTVICVLSHDPKVDVPVLRVALRSPAGYVGAMGSRRTHADRLRRLRAAGATEGELARLRSPIGLDLGARTPEETAVSITAEIIQSRSGGSGRPLRDTHGHIHPAPTVPTGPTVIILA
jgi:xanthine dehydrogenase accessory factor